MEDFRSSSCKMERFYGGKAEAKAPRSMQDLRSYSTSYAYSATITYQDQVFGGKEIVKMKKSKSKSTFGSKSWSFNDPELQRKTRVASYKIYTVEGKMKGSLRKSFKWMKNTYNQMIDGLR